MPNIPRELRVRKGDDIAKALQALVRYAESAEVYTDAKDADLKKIRMSQGTLVTANFKQSGWPHPFKIRGDARGVSVSSGTVGGLTPFIEGIPISGINEDGDSVDVPDIELENDSGALKTYIDIKAVLGLADDAKNKEATLLETPENLSIVHVESLNPEEVEGQDSNLTALYPIAKLYWTSGGTLTKIHQLVHHNLDHSYVESSESDEVVASRHYFWAT